MIIIAIFILFILYWYFNIRKNVIQIDMPIEKMQNISIFDGDIL